jgi:hypothetical protein
MVTLVALVLPGPLAAGGDFMVMLVVGAIWVVVQMINKRAHSAQPPTTPRESAPDHGDAQPVEDLADFLEKLKGDFPRETLSPTTHRPPPPIPNSTVFHKPNTANFSHVQRSTEPSAPSEVQPDSPSPQAPALTVSKVRRPIELRTEALPQYPDLTTDFSNRKALVQFILAREILGQPLALRRPDPETR